MLFYCCNITQLRGVSYFKQRPSISFIYDLPHTYTDSLSLIHTHGYSETENGLLSLQMKENKNDIRIQKKKKSDDINTRCVCVCVTDREKQSRDGTQSTGGLSDILFVGMMKIFPSRQPFVALVPGTACQICFSSQSCLHTVVVMHTSTHTVFLPHRPQQVCICGYVCTLFFLRKRKEARFWSTITSLSPLG